MNASISFHFVIELAKGHSREGHGADGNSRTRHKKNERKSDSPEDEAQPAETTTKSRNTSDYVWPRYRAAAPPGAEAITVQMVRMQSRACGGVTVQKL